MPGCSKQPGGTCGLSTHKAVKGGKIAVVKCNTFTLSKVYYQLKVFRGKVNC